MIGYVRLEKDSNDWYIAEIQQQPDGLYCAKIGNLCLCDISENDIKVNKMRTIANMAELKNNLIQEEIKSMILEIQNLASPVDGLSIWDDCKDDILDIVWRYCTK